MTNIQVNYIRILWFATWLACSYSTQDSLKLPELPEIPGISDVVPGIGVVPELYRAFGIYKDDDGTLVTPFGKWIPQGFQFNQNSIKQCPCEDTGSGIPKCEPYDPSFQASTLEEALENFKDTTESDPLFAKSIVPPSQPNYLRSIQDPELNAKVCSPTDTECLSCTKYTLMNMLNQLESQPSNPITDKLKAEVTKTLEKNGLNSYTIRPHCPELSQPEFSPPPDGDEQKSQRHLHDIEECISNVADKTGGPQKPVTPGTDRQQYNWTTHHGNSHSKGEIIHVNPSSNVPDWRRNVGRVGGKERTRAKRQTNGIPNEISQVFDIKCEPRGSPVSQGSTYLGLCGACWKWGVLDPQYTPSYINLMVCDKDTKCLSGWGKCQQRNRNFQVLKNTGTESNPRYERASINVPMMCDCQVQAGSALHNFIKN